MPKYPAQLKRLFSPPERIEGPRNPFLLRPREKTNLFGNEQDHREPRLHKSHTPHYPICHPSPQKSITTKSILPALPQPLPQKLPQPFQPLPTLQILLHHNLCKSPNSRFRPLPAIAPSVPHFRPQLAPPRPLSSLFSQAFPLNSSFQAT